MDVFALRHTIINDYSTYIRSFIVIRDDRIRDKVKTELGSGLLWLNVDPAQSCFCLGRERG